MFLKRTFERHLSMYENIFNELKYEHYDSSKFFTEFTRFPFSLLYAYMFMDKLDLLISDIDYAIRNYNSVRLNNDALDRLTACFIYTYWPEISIRGKTLIDLYGNDDQTKITMCISLDSKVADLYDSNKYVLYKQLAGDSKLVKLNCNSVFNKYVLSLV